MYCNHRSPKNPGACKDCWRFGIVMWSLMYTGVFYIVATHKALNTYGPLIDGLLLTALALIIIYSIVTRWNRGDDE